MNLWMITVGEPLPIDGKNERLYRTGILSQMMADDGHQVTWWTSSFNHTKRAQREWRESTVTLNPNLTLKIVSEPGYRKSVSLQRIFSHAICAMHFSREAKSMTRPDLMLVSYPTIELSLAAIRLGRKMQVPVVVDIRDLWPEIFLQVFPHGLKGFGRLCLWPYERLARKVFRNSDAIVGITRGIRDWGLRKAERPPGPWDRNFPMGYLDPRESAAGDTGSEEFWASLGITRATWNICFFGALGKQARFDSVIDAARIIEDKLPEVRFVICGTGERLPIFAERAKDRTNILFPGWVDKNQIASLMDLSRAGLTVYPESEDFLLSIPNKPIEYMSAGLPVLSNIDGALGSLVRKHGIGSIYNSADPGSLAGEIARLYENPDLVEKMGAASYSLFKRKFDAERVYSGYSQYLQAVAQIR